jgi:histidine ammonia-lyase
MDGLKIDMASIANWAHALMAMLVDPRFGNGLPPNLVQAPGLHSGFKGMQLSQTSLVVACRQMAGPSATLDSGAPFTWVAASRCLVRNGSSNQL